VGMTPLQGGMETIPQGEGPQVLSFQPLWVQRCETSWVTYIENWNICVRRSENSTGEPDAAKSCLSGSEGAGWRRTVVIR
jgi:hypothetical protein